MYSLFKKEINSFLNSLIGYISIAVFLIVIGLFLWVFPGNDLNIADSGYAAVDSLFNITPWVYMFLIPAITMRMFSEEKRTGTLEILLTKPLTEFQIVLAKYLSGLVLVIFSSFSHISPESGLLSPAISSSSCVLPDPDRPRST